MCGRAETAWPLCSRTPHSIPAIHEAETMAFRRGRLLAAVIPRRRTGRGAAPGARSSPEPESRAATPADRDSSAYVVRAAVGGERCGTHFVPSPRQHEPNLEQQWRDGVPNTHGIPTTNTNRNYHRGFSFHWRVHRIPEKSHHLPSRPCSLFVMRYEKSTNARRVLCSEGAGTGVRWTVLAYEVWEKSTNARRVWMVVLTSVAFRRGQNRRPVDRLGMRKPPVWIASRGGCRATFDRTATLTGVFFCPENYGPKRKSCVVYW